MNRLYRFATDKQIQAFIKADGSFLKLLNNNFNDTGNKKITGSLKYRELNWGIEKINTYKIPLTGSEHYWSGIFGEYYLYNMLKYSGIHVYRPEPKNKLTPDWECPNYIYEVKSKNYSSVGSAGEKSLGVPLKYAEIPNLYKKPLKIVLIGRMEYDAINKYGILGDNITTNKDRILTTLGNLGIEYVGGSSYIL